MVHWTRFAVCSLASVLVGCASSGAVRSVDAQTWESVPSETRDGVERAHAPALAEALQQQRAATTAADEARRALDRHLSTNAGATAPRAASGDADAWEQALRAHERALREALDQVHATKASWLRAELRWRERGRIAADRHVVAVRARIEWAKAQAVYDQMPADESFEVASFRGQYARARQAWSEAQGQARDAQQEAGRQRRELEQAKASYAQLRRDGPAAPPAAASRQAAGEQAGLSEAERR